jgi:hypothetical protein
VAALRSGATSIVSTSQGKQVVTSRPSVAFRKEIYGATALADPKNAAHAFTRIQDNIEEATASARSLPVNGGVYWPDVLFKMNTPQTIGHGLAARVAWMAVASRPGASGLNVTNGRIVEVTQNSAQGTITLSSNENVVADLWFFPKPLGAGPSLEAPGAATPPPAPIPLSDSIAIPGTLTAPPTVAGGGWSFINNGGTLTTAADISYGISFVVPQSATAGNGYVRAGSMTSTMSVEVGASYVLSYGTASEQTQFAGVGACMSESGSGKWLQWYHGVYFGGTGGDGASYIVLIGSNVASVVYYQVFPPYAQPFVRLRLSGANILAEASIDKQVWVTISSVPITTAFTTTPDHVGIAFTLAERGNTVVSLFDFVSL